MAGMDNLERVRAHFYDNTTSAVQKSDPKLYNLSAGLLYLTLG